MRLRIRQVAIETLEEGKAYLTVAVHMGKEGQVGAYQAGPAVLEIQQDQDPAGYWRVVEFVK